MPFVVIPEVFDPKAHRAFGFRFVYFIRFIQIFFHFKPAELPPRSFFKKITVEIIA